MKPQKIFIITGISGSGKTTAMAAFEDAGFYCVDNMPMALLPKFLDLPLKNDPKIKGFSFVMDMREHEFPTQYSVTIEALRERDLSPVTIFLDADENTLIKRFSQTRRHHPMSHDTSLTESIRSEKKEMLSIKNSAEILIDTSTYNPHRLKAEIVAIASGRDAKKHISMKTNIMSFGFKYGIPPDADLVIDMRFLSNPFFIPSLKNQDGESDDVKKFVLSLNETVEFLDKYLNLLDFLFPLYQKEGKAYLTIAVGCTGGRHRSVAIARKIFEHFHNMGMKTGIIHRDIDRDLTES
ncbi:MAG: RNase adapter RapZ [Desulfamplus sp.]|nr:RNase adapter RapZ [Desulfamplus sp.]MBF0259029.1 RNase adapter RapZ [Desulfamplus sp.]